MMSEQQQSSNWLLYQLTPTALHSLTELSADSYSLGAGPQRTPLATSLLLLCDITALCVWPLHNFFRDTVTETNYYGKHFIKSEVKHVQTIPSLLSWKSTIDNTNDMLRAFMWYGGYYMLQGHHHQAASYSANVTQLVYKIWLKS